MAVFLQLSRVMLKYKEIILFFIFILASYGCRDDRVSPINNDVSSSHASLIENKVKDLSYTYNIVPSSIAIIDSLILENENTVIAGQIHSQKSKLTHSFLIMLDKSGNLIWEKILNFNNIKVPEKIYELPNGELLLIGYYTKIEGHKYAQVASDIWLQKCSLEDAKI